MDFTDRCHYCNNCINSRNGYGMYEHHTVTNDIRIWNLQKYINYFNLNI